MWPATTERGVDGGAHVVRAHHGRATRHGPGGGGERSLQPVVDGNGPGRRRQTHRGSPPGSPCGWCPPGPGSRSRRTRRGGPGGRGCARDVLPKPMPGSIHTSGTPAAGGRVRASDERIEHLGHDVVVARVVLHRGRLALGVHGRPGHAQLGGDGPVGGADVVQERRARGDGRPSDRGLAGVDATRGRPRRPMPRTTGTTRRSSSSSDTGAAPGRVDSPPTSSESAPIGEEAHGRGRWRRRGRRTGRRPRTSRGSR